MIVEGMCASWQRYYLKIWICEPCVLCARWMPRFLTRDKTVSRRCSNWVSREVSQQHSRMFAPLLLHSRDKTTIKTMDWKERAGSEEGEDRAICRQDHGVGFLGCACDNFHGLSLKRELIATLEQINQAKTATIG